MHFINQMMQNFANGGHHRGGRGRGGRCGRGGYHGGGRFGHMIKDFISKMGEGNPG